MANLKPLRPAREMLKVCRSSLKGCGNGVKALKEFKAHKLICEYLGELISDDERKTRKRGLPKDADTNYSFEMITNEIASKNTKVKQTFVDAFYFGSDARFIQHKCLPNAYPDCFENRYSNTVSVGIFASEAIKENQEIFIDYTGTRKGEFDREKQYTDTKKMGLKCKCQSEYCYGTI